MAKQRGLGKGLSSLIPTAAESEVVSAAASPITAPEPETTSKGVASELFIGTDKLIPNPFQPRKSISIEHLGGLIASIKEHGVIQPILVRKHDDDQYQIIAGERRWRAAMAADCREVPVRVLDIDDAGTMEIALVENLQREDLNAIEIAEGIQDLIEKLTLTHEEVAHKIGLSRTAVTNKLRLLQLPPVVIEMLEKDEITEGHARALLSLQNEDKMISYANLTTSRGLNVRQLEALVRNAGTAEKIDAVLPRKEQRSSDFSAEIDQLEKKYKLTVKVAGNRKGMGVLIKGLKKWQVQLLLEYIERHNDELFPRE